MLRKLSAPLPLVEYLPFVRPAKLYEEVPPVPREELRRSDVEAVIEIFRTDLSGIVELRDGPRRFEGY